jgi:uncharacterized RDD family membrane protein YckC
MASARALASLPRRIAAVTYESLLLGALVLALGFAMLPLSGLSTTGERSLAVLPPAARAVSFSIIFAVCGAYSVWSWTGGRRTLAMKTWRIALENASGPVVTARQALLRYLACWIAPACAILAYLPLRHDGHGRWALALLALNHAWAFIDPDRQFLHDRIAGTRLVAQLPSRKRTQTDAAAHSDADY